MAKVTTTGGKTVRSPISSMRSSLRSLKNNIKSGMKSVLGLEDAVQKENELKKKRLENVKTRNAKEKDLRQKQSKEKRLEKPNLVSTSFSNIGKTLKKTGKGILGRVLQIVGLFAGAWLIKNIPDLIKTVEKGIKVITDIWERAGNFVGGIIDTVKGLAKVVLAFGENLVNFDFADSSGKLKEAFDEVELGWNKLSGAITGAEQTLENPENDKKINDALEGKEANGNGEGNGEDTELDSGGKSDENTKLGEVDLLGEKDKVNPLIVLEDNMDLIEDKYSIGSNMIVNQIKDEIKKNPEKYDTRKEINDALSGLGIDPSEIKYRDSYPNLSSTSTTTVEGKQTAMVGKVDQQVNAAGQKLNNDQLTIEGKQALNVASITPQFTPEVITVVAPSNQKNNMDYGSGRSGIKLITVKPDLNKLENLKMLEAIG